MTAVAMDTPGKVKGDDLPEGLRDASGVDCLAGKAKRRGRVRSWVGSHPLLSFVLLTYALSWAYWVPLVATGHVVQFGSAATQFPGLAGPLLAAFAVTVLTQGWAGVRDLASRVPRWRVPARWWLFAVGTPLALLGLAFVVLAIGPGVPGLAAFGHTAGLEEPGVFRTVILLGFMLSGVL